MFVSSRSVIRDDPPDEPRSHRTITESVNTPGNVSLDLYGVDAGIIEALRSTKAKCRKGRSTAQGAVTE
jgi:hypothetical protein